MAQPLPPEIPLKHARRNDDGFYTWDGVQYKSVTTYLGAAAGQHLLSWYAKMAPQECATQLELRDEERISAEECDARIRDVGMRMRAAERYRDHKARIGSLTHRALYERVMAPWKLEGSLPAYLLMAAREIDVFKEYGDEPRSDGDYQSLVAAAEPYVKSAFAWLDKWQPTFEAVGLEAMVVSERYGYAGTTDGIMTIALDADESDQGITARSLRFLREKLGMTEATGIMDAKTSNSLSAQVQMQVEAYANADFIGLPATGDTFALSEMDFVSALHISPTSCDLHVWDRSPEMFEGFLGLCAYVDAIENRPRPARVVRAAKPKPEPVRTTVRACPFGGK